MATTRAAVLDWQAFSDAYFPGRRRHDFEALIAYGAYRRSEGADKSGHADEQRAALETWEDEGGPTD